MSTDIQSIANDFLAVVNSEGQFSIWPTMKELPAGWNAAGKDGTREECLQYIAHVWNDMRPNSLREKAPISDEVLADVLKV
ncbi:MbtH family NRPS accessory protein [Rouxiella badensis]|uniref:MbtH family protein n=1 Tax=Rouxiella badensis TaxID=1646377 RepID=UPI001D13CE0C|nr:MbtH family NRPS accessory protein [Rouxiella badensis]MCC3721476.1 MbtH family NRPS accessory protein [Rouxiella badensis]MCC3731074.1 MbtH family NRPS accessory protein [Rouxiella badensis]